MGNVKNSIKTNIQKNLNYSKFWISSSFAKVSFVAFSTEKIAALGSIIDWE